MRYNPYPKRGHDEEGHALGWGPLGQGCFRCAVDFVIDGFGGDPNCKCRSAFSVSLAQQGQAIGTMTKAHWIYFRQLCRHIGAKLYAGMAGSWSVQQENGMFLLHKSNEVAALRFLASARTDPIAYDAALYLVADWTYPCSVPVRCSC